MTDDRNEWRVRHRSKVSEAQPGDEQQGGWPRARLEAMDAEFCHALERAVEAGKERAPMSTVSRALSCA